MHFLLHTRASNNSFFLFPDSPIVQCDVVNSDDDHNSRKIFFTSLNKYLST